MNTKIVVVCSSSMPRYRAGIYFSGAQEFDLNHFSAEQLHELLADRLLMVVVGNVLKHANVDGFAAFAAEQAELHPDLHPNPALETSGPVVDPYLASATTGERELVSGLEVYPAGSQAAVLPAPGEIVVNPETAGGTVNQAPHVPPVVVSAHRGRGHSRS